MKPAFAPHSLPSLPRPLRIVFAALLSLASIVMVLLLVAFLALTTGALWLSSTHSGQSWLSTQLSTLTAGSGQRIELGRIRALGSSRIGIDALGVFNDDDTPVMLAQNIIITPSLTALLNDTAAIDLHADAMLLYSQPDASPVTTTVAPLAPLIPDAQTLRSQLHSVPFQKISIADLNIDTLVMMDARGKPTQILRPKLTLHAHKTTEGLTADLGGHVIGVLDGDAAIEISGKARLALDVEKPQVIIDALAVNAPTFDHTLTGYLDLPRTPDNQDNLGFEFTSPLADNQKISITGDMQQQAGLLNIEHLDVSAPGLQANAAVNRNAAGTWSGTSKTTADFTTLSQFVPQLAAIDLSEELEAVISFDDTQLAVDAPRLTYMGAQLRDIKLNIAPLPAQSAGSRTITLNLREASSASTLTASTDLIYTDGAQTWQVENLTARLNAGKAGTLFANGRVDTQALDLTLTTTAFRPDRLAGILSAGDIPPLRIDDAKLHAYGGLAAPEITLSGNVTPASLPKGAPSITAAITARLADGMLDATAKLKSRALSSGGATLKQPMTLTLSPFSFDIKNSGLDGAASLRGNLNALGGFMPVGVQFSGDTQLAVLASGSLKEPQTSGTLRISKGRLRDSATGIALQDIALSGRFDQNTIAIENMSARDNKRGRLQGNGRLTLAPGRWPVDAQLKLTDIDPFTRAASAISSIPVIDGVLDADLKLSGSASRYTLAGTLGSDKLDITLPATFASSVPQLNVVEKGAGKKGGAPGLAALALDIAVRVPRQIFVRGWGLDAEFGGALQLKGTAEQPSATGTLQSLRGRYEEFGRRFALTRAKLDFRGAIPPSPYLDIVAETKVDGITAQVVLGGSATQPKITFTSDPPLPQEDVLSRILFGRERASISPTQALQMAQTLRRFSGGGQGLDPLGRLRSGIGLDDLSVDSDEDGGTSVGAGKYLSDDVYLEVGGGEKGGAAKVQIELTPNVKVESKVGQDAGAGGGIFWEWEY